MVVVVDEDEAAGVGSTLTGSWPVTLAIPAPTRPAAPRAIAATPAATKHRIEQIDSYQCFRGERTQGGRIKVGAQMRGDLLAALTRSGFSSDLASASGAAAVFDSSAAAGVADKVDSGICATLSTLCSVSATEAGTGKTEASSVWVVGKGMMVAAVESL